MKDIKAGDKIEIEINNYDIKNLKNIQSEIKERYGVEIKLNEIFNIIVSNMECYIEGITTNEFLADNDEWLYEEYNIDY